MSNQNELTLEQKIQLWKEELAQAEAEYEVALATMPTDEELEAGFVVPERMQVAQTIENRVDSLLDIMSLVTRLGIKEEDYSKWELYMTGWDGDEISLGTEIMRPQTDQEYENYFERHRRDYMSTARSKPEYKTLKKNLQAKKQRVEGLKKRLVGVLPKDPVTTFVDALSPEQRKAFSHLRRTGAI